MIKRIPVLLTVFALSAFAAACGDDEQDAAAGGAASTQQSAPAASEDIVGVAQGEDRLSTLVQAVTAAELAETLKGEGPYTVFAPTNQAFGALPQGTLDQLLAPAGKEQLTDVLTYHVVQGDVKAADLSDGQTIKTVQGQELTVSINGDEVKIGDATVVQPDVNAANGTVHVIDQVLQPKA